MCAYRLAYYHRSNYISWPRNGDDRDVLLRPETSSWLDYCRGSTAGSSVVAEEEKKISSLRLNLGFRAARQSLLIVTCRSIDIMYLRFQKNLYY